MRTSQTAHWPPRASAPGAQLRFMSVSFIPAGRKGPRRLLRRTFQELAEVEVVLQDHVWDHLLVQAYDLEQNSLQKNGFRII